MRALARALGGVLLAAAAGGCLGNQETRRYEFYEPTDATLTRRADGYCAGAVKSETVKSGVRDEGDKSLAVGIVNVN